MHHLSVMSPHSSRRPRAAYVNLAAAGGITALSLLLAATQRVSAHAADHSHALSTHRASGASGGSGAFGATAERRPVVGVIPDTVRGVVFDSLAGRPLSDAFVTAEPGGATATSDSLGQFVIVSDERVTQLAAFHESLDETGISGLVAQRPVDAQRWTDALLTTPSMLTIWRGVCAAEYESEAYQGVLVGTVVLPDGRTRIPEARVRVQYQVIVPGSGLAQIQEREARTDSLGNFAVCGTPSAGEVAVLGSTETAESSPVLLELVERPVRRIDLVLAPVDGPMNRWPTLTGQVVSEDGTPIPNARLSVTGKDGLVLTDSSGNFAVSAVRPGSRMISVQADGHIPVASPVNVLYDTTPGLTIGMSRAFNIPGFEGFAITERTSIRPARRAYEERRRSSIAVFLDSATVLEAGSVRAALSQVPFLELRRPLASDDSTQFEVLGRGFGLGVQSCQAFVFLDGQLVENVVVSEVTAESVAAIELYRSASQVPPPFAEFVDRDCSAVLLWSRYGLRP